MNLLFVDVENNENNDILSISYIFINIKTNEYNMEHYLIKCNSSKKDMYYKTHHHLHTNILQSRGFDKEYVLNRFIEYVNKCDKIVGHYVISDINKIYLNILQYNKDFDKLVLFNKFDENYDTYNFEKQLGNKNNKLQNVYIKYFNDEELNWHSSYDDIIATYKIFCKQHNIQSINLYLTTENNKFHNRYYNNTLCISKDCCNQYLINYFTKNNYKQSTNYYFIN